MQRIVPILMILLAAGIGFGYIYPTYTNKVVPDLQQIASYDSALTAASAFSQKEATLTTQQNAIAPADLARLNTYLPDGVDNIQLIVDLDALAAKSGVALSGFTIQKNANDSAASVGNASSSPVASTFASTNTTDSLDLSVAATGTYDAFQTFLTTAEQSARPLDVTKLSLKYANTGVYTYTIVFRIYWLK